MSMIVTYAVKTKQTKSVKRKATRESSTTHQTEK